ncbi:MAG: 4-(cytidine 5'-diphospho)-2-C-methyl-D-erythritol kinase [Chloroflexota bacterium]
MTSIPPGLLALSAPAKVNLTLEVLRRRDDGYHDIRTVMQAVSLSDRLTFAPAETLHLRSNRPEMEGPDNLVWQAATLLRQETRTAKGASIFLEKRIPVTAGLGGGSSDAAAALLGLNALWELGVPRARLLEIGAQVGSDVPFFLGESGCALAEGRGERITPLPDLPRRWVVLVKPALAISTAAVYRAYPRERWSDGRRTSAWMQQMAFSHEVPPPFNDLEAIALQVAPDAARARAALLDAGAPAALMSGSGPTYFALFDTESAAQTVHHRLVSGGHESYLASFCNQVDLPTPC